MKNVPLPDRIDSILCALEILPLPVPDADVEDRSAHANCDNDTEVDGRTSRPMAPPYTALLMSRRSYFDTFCSIF